MPRQLNSLSQQVQNCSRDLIIISFKGNEGFFVLFLFLNVGYELMNPLPNEFVVCNVCVFVFMRVCVVRGGYYANEIHINNMKYI